MLIRPISAAIIFLTAVSVLAEAPKFDVDKGIPIIQDSTVLAGSELLFSPNSEFLTLISPTQEGRSIEYQWRQIKLKDAEKAIKPQPKKLVLYSPTFSSCGRYFTNWNTTPATSQFNTLEIYDAHTLKVLWKDGSFEKKPPHLPYQLFTSSGRYFLSWIHKTGSVFIHDAATGKELGRTKQPLHAPDNLFISSDESTLVQLLQDSIEVYDLATGKLRAAHSIATVGKFWIGPNKWSLDADRLYANGINGPPQLSHDGKWMIICPFRGLKHPDNDKPIMIDLATGLDITPKWLVKIPQIVMSECKQVVFYENHSGRSFVFGREGPLTHMKTHDLNTGKLLEEKKFDIVQFEKYQVAGTRGVSTLGVQGSTSFYIVHDLSTGKYKIMPSSYGRGYTESPDGNWAASVTYGSIPVKGRPNQTKSVTNVTLYKLKRP